MYADDMALTSPSLRGLQKLLMATVGYVAKCNGLVAIESEEY